MSNPAKDLNHVLDNVLKLDDKSKLGLIHFGIHDIFDLMSIDPHADLQGEYIAGTSGEQTSGFLHQLSAMTIRHFASLQSWFNSQPSHVDWLALDQMTFCQFSMGL